MDMTWKEAIAELNTFDGVTIGVLDGEPEILYSSRFVKALELAIEALKKIASITPVGDVHPDWYDRLSKLEYNHYCAEMGGEPWYRAKDVWACIEGDHHGDS